MFTRRGASLSTTVVVAASDGTNAREVFTEGGLVQGLAWGPNPSTRVG